MQIDVTIGWTMSDRANGYSSFDGYRPGARQHTETISIDWDLDLNIAHAPEHIAEACFEVTNAPYVIETGIAGQITEALAATGYHGEQAGHYSLSVGDTVTVGEVTLACDRFGWKRVSLLGASA